MVARAHGRRQSATRRGARTPRLLPGAVPWSLSSLSHPPQADAAGHLTCVFHADTQSAYGTQSGLPLSQVAIGVFHSAIELK